MIDGIEAVSAARRGTAIGIPARAVSIICSTASTAVATRYLGAAGFGVFSTVGSLFVLLSFTDQGIGVELVNRITRSLHAKDQPAMERSVATGWAALLLAAGLVTLGAATLVLFVPISSIVGSTGTVSDVDVMLAVALLATLFAVSVVSGLADRLRSALHQNWVSSLCAATGSVVSLLAVVFIVIIDGGFVAVVAAASCGLVAGQAVNLSLLCRARPWTRPSAALRARAQDVRGLYAAGAPFALLNALSAAALFTDTLIVNAALGPVAAATYAVPAKAATVITSVLALIAVPLMPVLIAADHDGDTNRLRELFRGCVRRSAGAAVIAAGFFLAFGQPLLRIWTGERIPESRLVVVGEAVWIILFAIGNVVNVLLSSRRRLRVQVQVNLVMAAANVALSLVLVREVGVAGPIIATDATYALCVVLPLLLHVRHDLSGQCRGPVLARRSATTRS